MVPLVCAGDLSAVYCSSHVDRQIMGILWYWNWVPAIHKWAFGRPHLRHFLRRPRPLPCWRTVPIAAICFFGRNNMVGHGCVCAFVDGYAQLAMARIGVGIGEAGSSPPSHSMISDLFPKLSGQPHGNFRNGH